MASHHPPWVIVGLRAYHATEEESEARRRALAVSGSVLEGIKGMRDASMVWQPAERFRPVLGPFAFYLAAKAGRSIMPRSRNTPMIRKA